MLIKIIKDLDLSIEFKSHKRLGLFTSGFNRPLKCFFNSNQKVRLFFSKKKSLPSRISISSDKTPLQSKLLKEAIEEANIRNIKITEGDEKYVSFISGFPAVVKKEKKVHVMSK